MNLTNNVHITKWVEEMAALCKPESIVWIDGSEEQLEQLPTRRWARVSL